MSLRAISQDGVAISWIYEYFCEESDEFPFFLGDRHTSLRTGSR